MTTPNEEMAITLGEALEDNNYKNTQENVKRLCECLQNSEEFYDLLGSLIHNNDDYFEEIED